MYQTMYLHVKLLTFGVLTVTPTTHTFSHTPHGDLTGCANVASEAKGDHCAELWPR